jgi:hypothetical protein
LGKLKHITYCYYILLVYVCISIIQYGRNVYVYK